VFTPNLAALLTGVPTERLLEWERQGLLHHGRHSPGRYSISDLKAVDALRTTLEVELGERTSELKAAGKAKSDFMRLVAHELRAPMSVARGYLSMVGDGSLGPVPAGIRQALGIVDGRLQEMERLVQQLLEVARVEDGRLMLDDTPLDLRDLVLDAAELAGPLADPQHEITVSVPTHEIPVRGDRARLLMILGNLISNAIKYSPEGGPVECSAESDGTWATASVSDHGIGISERQLLHLFAAFARVESAQTTDISGTGLGLYVSQELARRHGGRIAVASEPGAGSTFSLVIPVGLSAPAGSRAG
jgi:signal transduction histidine kinase